MTPRWGDIHGVIRDAAPDAWGRRVQEARDRRPLTELDYLLRPDACWLAKFSSTTDHRAVQHRLDSTPDVAIEIEASHVPVGTVVNVFAYSETSGGTVIQSAPPPAPWPHPGRPPT